MKKHAQFCLEIRRTSENTAQNEVCKLLVKNVAELFHIVPQLPDVFTGLEYPKFPVLKWCLSTSLTVVTSQNLSKHIYDLLSQPAYITLVSLWNYTVTWTWTDTIICYFHTGYQYTHSSTSHGTQWYINGIRFQLYMFVCVWSKCQELHTHTRTHTYEQRRNAAKLLFGSSWSTKIYFQKWNISKLIEHNY